MFFIFHSGIATPIPRCYNIVVIRQFHGLSPPLATCACRFTDCRINLLSSGGMFMKPWQILLIILAIAAIVLLVLYILGSRMQKKQEAAQAQLDAMKQVTSLLIIDKKMLPVSKSGLPQIAIDQTPKYLRWQKLPIVKAKLGPQIMTMACDKDVFDVLPLQKECKVEVSGMYITGIKAVRGGAIPTIPKKPTLKERIFGNKADKEAAQEQDKRDQEASLKRQARKERQEKVAAQRAEAAKAKAAAAAEQAEAPAKKNSGKSKSKKKNKGHSGKNKR